MKKNEPKAYAALSDLGVSRKHLRMSEYPLKTLSSTRGDGGFLVRITKSGIEKKDYKPKTAFLKATDGLAQKKFKDAIKKNQKASSTPQDYSPPEWVKQISGNAGIVVVPANQFQR